MRPACKRVNRLGPNGRDRDESHFALSAKNPAGAATAPGHFDNPAMSQMGVRRGKAAQMGVRRGKAAFFSGCKSHPATIAPAGSNRSSHGGDEMAEVLPRITRELAQLPQNPFRRQQNISDQA